LKVLLTGGTGFLGRAVARRLAADGHELRLLAREGSKLRGLPGGIEVRRGDVTDSASFAAAAIGCEAVMHMAGLVKTWLPDSTQFDRVNMGGLTNALTVARNAGARLVYTSSFIAVGPTGETPADERQVHEGYRFRNDYERTKALADAEARRAIEFGQDVVILYPGVVYGPGELNEANLVVKMIRDHLAGRLPGIVGSGEPRWSYAFIEDVAQAHVAALDRGRKGERYFLGGDNVSMNDFFALLESLSGRPAPRWHIPYPAASAMGYLLWLWAEHTGRPPDFTHREVAVFREHWAYASGKAQAELGYRVTPLREGLRTTLEWLSTLERRSSSAA
jgi:nucleoside-diphosphate-sugar epimerase